MKKILIPTDFSKNAWHAINYAITLYEKHFCEFYLLHAYEVSETSLKSGLIKTFKPGKIKRLQQEAQEGLLKLGEMLKLKNSAYHRFKTMALEGNPVELIQQVVNQEQIELIIMGSQGATRSRKVAFGTVALYVMESVENCPCIVVPETTEIKTPKEIVFATSLRDAFKFNEFDQLKELAHIDNANIAVLHIAEHKKLDAQQHAYKIELIEQLKLCTHSFHLLEHDSILEGIRLFTESRNSDMIAFFNTKHSFFGNVLVQPLIKKLNFYTKVPLLVLHL